MALNIYAVELALTALDTKNLIVQFVPHIAYGGPDKRNITANKTSTLHTISEEFDLVVLSVGMEISEFVRDLGRNLNIELDKHGFCKTNQFNPIETSRPGIFAIGPFREPKDIPEFVIEASSAAAATAGLLVNSRWQETHEKEYPPERDISGEKPRIGVFVCHCGSNIGGFLDVKSVVDFASCLPDVVNAEDNLYTCSQDSIATITEKVKELKLNRVVVASCSPLTHGPLFQDSIRSAGLNPFVFEMANIRNQCSWVHSDNWIKATTKAKELVGMAVARASLLVAQKTIEVDVQSAGLVLGGGVAGMAAALSLAEQNFQVHLIERKSYLGGNLREILTSTLDGQNPQSILKQLIEKVNASKTISVHLNCEIVQTSGHIGNFITTIQNSQKNLIDISHGITILATGAQEYRGPEYGYGQNPRIITQSEFERIIAREPEHEDQNSKESSEIIQLNSVVMIQCIGPAEKYCSRICCTVALKNALALKKRNPDSQVTILYKDIRAYGFKERLYTKARELGVIFIRYEDHSKPKVFIDNERIILNDNNRNDGESSPEVKIKIIDPFLKREIILKPDFLVLSMPVIPNPDASKLSTIFKVPLDSDGFFQEAHVKLRPVDFSTDGIFMAGMAHYPKFVDESMVQAQAAAARAARVLSQKSLKAGGRVAIVDENLCTGCLTCVRVCPFGIPNDSVRYHGSRKNYGGCLYRKRDMPRLWFLCGGMSCPCDSNHSIHRLTSFQPRYLRF